jgi:hypothetical protein
MFAFRYAALAALVLWVGVTATALGNELFGSLVARVHLVGLVCGAIVMASLFIIKFVGPPPRAFPVRAAIVFVMVALTLYAARIDPASVVLLGVNLALGFVLLYWYSRE